MGREWPSAEAWERYHLTEGFLVGKALEDAQVQHSDAMPDNPNETIEDVINTMSAKQQDVLHYLVSEALASVASHSDTTNTNDDPAIHGDLNP